MKKNLNILIVFLALFINLLVIGLPKKAFAQGSCLTVEEAIDSRGWEGIEQVEDNGVRVNLPDDSDLPPGFEAVTEDAGILINDPDRFMHSGIWSIYRTCSGEVEPPDTTCPSINDLIARKSWEGIDQVDGFGVRVRTFLDDSLPFGYVGISENSYLTVEDPDRFMKAGVWSIYRQCGEDQ